MVSSTSNVRRTIIHATAAPVRLVLRRRVDLAGEFSDLAAEGFGGFGRTAAGLTGLVSRTGETACAVCPSTTEFAGSSVCALSAGVNFAGTRTGRRTGGRDCWLGLFSILFNSFLTVAEDPLPLNLEADDKKTDIDDGFDHSCPERPHMRSPGQALNEKGR